MVFDPALHGAALPTLRAGVGYHPAESVAAAFIRTNSVTLATRTGTSG